MQLEALGGPTGVADRLERRPPGEVLVPAHREAESGRERVVLGVDVLRPEAVALLEPQRVERAAARRDQAVLSARLPQHVPRPLAHRDLPVELPAELARVADALGPYRRDLADAQVSRVMYGNASFDTSTSVTADSTSRALGPQSPSANNDPVRTVICTRSPSRICGRRNASS